MYYGSIGRNKHKCITNEYRLHKQTIEHTEQKKICFLFCHYILNFLYVSIDLFILLWYVECVGIYLRWILGKEWVFLQVTTCKKKRGHTQICNGNYFQFLTTSHCTNISNRRNMFALSCIICIVFQKISHIHKFSWSLQKVLQLLWYTNVVSCCIK